MLICRWVLFKTDKAASYPIWISGKGNIKEYNPEKVFDKLQNKNKSQIKMEKYSSKNEKRLIINYN